jgi:hypothetical protein
VAEFADWANACNVDSTTGPTVPLKIADSKRSSQFASNAQLASSRPKTIL